MFVDETSRALGAIDAQSARLTDLIAQGKTTAGALASDNSSLSEGLQDLPSALSEGSQAFRHLREQALPSLAKLVDATGQVTEPLSTFLPELNPVLSEARPTLAQLADMFNTNGQPDLYQALVKLPALATQVQADFPRAITTLDKSTPIFDFVRPYIPDLVAWVDNWDGIFGPYDANGHYARSVPVFDDFTANGAGALTQVAPFARGLESTVSHYNYSRCPGGAADGATQWTSSGAACNPSEQVGH